MFKHNLHIAWRQWRSSGSYSLINLGGLSAGLLIGLWIGIALLTVSTQALRAALANPVKSLHSE